MEEEKESKKLKLSELRVELFNISRVLQKWYSANNHSGNLVADVTHEVWRGKKSHLSSVVCSHAKLHNSIEVTKPPSSNYILCHC